MSCRYRHRMWCNCKKPAKPFPPVPVESVGIVGWDASGTQTFQAQDNPYYASFSIEVLPTDATNKMITITSSNTRVINWAVYDSTAVTFTIEGEGDAEVTITSQANPEISTTYSVTVTPPTPPFSPTNSILVEPTRGKPTRGNAILKFFATDGESVDYVQARLGTNNKLTYVTYYGACEGNEYCEEMFSNETIKEELGASIGNYIDEYGIPETGAMTFTDEMYSIIEDYFAGEANIEDIITEIETGDIVEPVEPESCPVRVNNVTNSISLEEGAIDTVNFTVTYSCSHPDYSDLMAVSSNNSVAQVNLDAQHGVINVTGASAGNCTITLTDFYDIHTISVTVTEPALESITISDMGIEEMTLGTTYYFPYTSAPSGAPVKQLSLIIDNPELANASIDNGNVVIEPLQEGQISFYLFDGYTGVQSNTLTFDITEGGGGDCPVYISDCTEEDVYMLLEESYPVSFMLSYDCETPDYSNLSVTSDDESVATVELNRSEEHFDIYSQNTGSCVITFTDGENTYSFNVYVESGEPIDGDGEVRLESNESDGAWGIASFNFSGDINNLRVYARKDDEEISDEVVHVEIHDYEEEGEWQHYVEVTYYYPQSADDLLDEFELVFEDTEAPAELTSRPVYAYVSFVSDAPTAELITPDVNVLRDLSVDSGNLVASYGDDDVTVAAPNLMGGDGEFYARGNYNHEYGDITDDPDARLIYMPKEAGKEMIYQGQKGLQPIFLSSDTAIPNYYFDLGQSEVGRDPDNPIVLPAGHGHDLIRFSYHSEQATNFDNIHINTDEEHISANIIDTHNGEGHIEVEGLVPGDGRMELECVDDSGRYAIYTEQIYFRVDDDSL